MTQGVRPLNDPHPDVDPMGSKGENAKRKSVENQLDVAEEDSFPASDPPSMTDPMKTVKKAEEEPTP